MKKLHQFLLEDIARADNEMNGFCIACGHEQHGCEPDARKYECEACEENHVYGAQEIVLMGLVY